MSPAEFCFDKFCLMKRKDFCSFILYPATISRWASARFFSAISFAAIVNRAGYFGFQLVSMYNSVDKTMLQQKLTGLKPFG